MQTNLISFYPTAREVAFGEEGPYLISSRDYEQDYYPGRRIEPRGEVRGEEDDSLEVVLSSDTGAGRAHTPQRLNRTNTPQRPRSSSLLYTAPAPVQISTACRSEGDERRHPPGRRKQRRRDNDNLVSVEKILRGRHVQEDGEAEHLTVSIPKRSSLAVLMSDQNNSAEVVILREKIRRGLQPEAASWKGQSSGLPTRHFAGGKWEDAEERFLLVERRLRDVIVKALRNSSVLNLVIGMESLLDTFAKQQQVAQPADLSEVLRAALAEQPTVELSREDGRTTGPLALVATLSVPLGPSPFYRLLFHGLCQYRRLRSRSEQTVDGRVVRVTLPLGREVARAMPSATLAEFVVQVKLLNPAMSPRDPCRALRGFSQQANGMPKEPAGARARSCIVGVEAL